MSLLHVVEARVVSTDVDAAVAFLVTAFGLDILHVGPGGDVVVGVAGSPGGRVRVSPAAASVAAASLEPAGSSAATGAGGPALWDLGPRLLGIYSRSLPATMSRVHAAGGEAREPVTYPYGARTLTEAVARGTDGVWWTIPEAGDGHRPSPALSADPHRLHSELHSAVLVVDDHDAAVAFFVDGGGLRRLFDATMDSEPMQRLVGMPPGASLRLTFLAGPDEAPARLEIMSFRGVPGADRRDAPLGLRRLVFAVDDERATHQDLRAVGAEVLGENLLRGPAGVEIALVTGGARPSEQ